MREGLLGLFKSYLNERSLITIEYPIGDSSE